jgi:hypothetical protein
MEFIDKSYGKDGVAVLVVIVDVFVAVEDARPLISVCLAYNDMV